MMTQKTKTRCKLLFDLIMLIFLVLLYNKRTINMHFHEIGGLVLFALFIVHNGINWRWIKNAGRKIFSKSTGARLRLQWLLNLLLFLSFAVIILTGIMITKTLPFSIQGLAGAKKWHYFAAALSILLMGIHLGLHWPMAKAIGNKLTGIPRRILMVLSCLLLCSSIAWGSYSMVTGSYLNWISGPFITSASEESHDGGNHSNGNGSGNENGSGKGKSGSSDTGTLNGNGSGKGKGYGHGNGEGNGNGVQSFSVQNVLNVAATYGSEILLFSYITGAIDALCMRRKKRKAIQTAASADIL